MTSFPTLEIERAVLVKARILNDRGDILAIWQDNIGRFSAVHGRDGRVQTAPEGVTAPRLTAEQVAMASPPRHPAYDLADKGTAARPDLAKRMEKAARLVAAGAVQLIPAGAGTPETAVVRSSRPYTVNGRTCDCDWQRHHPGSWCSHALAVRMARAIERGAADDGPAESVGAPTPTPRQREDRQPQAKPAPQLHSYKLLHPAGGAPYVLALWQQPGQGMFPVQYGIDGRLLSQPGWCSSEKPPALPDEIVERLAHQQSAAEMAVTPPETKAQRELRLGGFRNARVLRQEIYNRGRHVKPPKTRVRRRVFVDGRWVAQER